MELMTLKNILNDLKYYFRKQDWIVSAGGNFFLEYKRREKDIGQLEEMIEDTEEKQEAYTSINTGYPRLSNIRIPVGIDIEIERYIKPERMDHIEKGAHIGKAREGR